MTWTYTDEYYKNYTRDTWNESAVHYDPIRRNLDLVNPALLRVAAPQPGERVLDIATGPGEPALTLAPLVAPSGSVVGVDLAEQMIEIARGNAKTQEKENASFEVMDAENLTFEDASFDLVVSRFGLQIVTDPEKAIAEAFRVLKPGARFATTVWGPGERTPALHVCIGPMLEHAEPDETGYLPTPYEMGGEGELVKMMLDAGFTQAQEERVTLEWTFKDEDEFFHALLKGTPIGHSLSEEEPDVQEDVLRKTRENIQKWKTPEGIRMPAEFVVVGARK